MYRSPSWQFFCIYEEEECSPVVERRCSQEVERQCSTLQERRCFTQLVQKCGQPDQQLGCDLAQVLLQQCSGSMTFWCRSGSADPCFCLMNLDPDADPDPAIFIIDLQDANKKLTKKTSFSAYYFLKVHLHKFSKIKSLNEVTKR